MSLNRSNWPLMSLNSEQLINMWFALILRGYWSTDMKKQSASLQERIVEGGRGRGYGYCCLNFICTLITARHVRDLRLQLLFIFNLTFHFMEYKLCFSTRFLEQSLAVFCIADLPIMLNAHTAKISSSTVSFIIIYGCHRQTDRQTDRHAWRPILLQDILQLIRKSNLYYVHTKFCENLYLYNFKV
jgi:hypothetical protein